MRSNSRLRAYAMAMTFLAGSAALAIAACQEPLDNIKGTSTTVPAGDCLEINGIQTIRFRSPGGSWGGCLTFNGNQGNWTNNTGGDKEAEVC